MKKVIGAEILERKVLGVPSILFQIKFKILFCITILRPKDTIKNRVKGNCFYIIFKFWIDFHNIQLSILNSQMTSPAKVKEFLLIFSDMNSQMSIPKFI